MKRCCLCLLALPLLVATRAKAQTARLTIESNIAGASIYINGQREPDWTTPHPFLLKAGTYRIAVLSPGLETWFKTVSLTTGQRLAVRAILSRGHGGIKLATEPPGLDVFIDGKPQGKSPVYVSLTEGQHTYRIGTSAESPLASGTLDIKAGYFKGKLIRIAAADHGSAGPGEAVQKIPGSAPTVGAKTAVALPQPLMKAATAEGAERIQAMERPAAAAPAAVHRPSTNSHGLYGLEPLIAFNVLDRVTIDPETSAVTLVGHYDARYERSKTPYLQDLATFLRYPRPELSLDWTPESEGRIDRFLNDFAHENGDFSLSNRERLTTEWTHYFDGSGHLTPTGRLMMPVLGIQPNSATSAGGDPWANFTRNDYVEGLIRVGLGPQAAAYVHARTAASPNPLAMADALGLAPTLDRLRYEVQQGRMSKEAAVAQVLRTICSALDGVFQLSGGPTRAFDESQRQGTSPTDSLEKCLGEVDNSLPGAQRRALDAVLTRPDGLRIPPELVDSSFGIHPEVSPRYIGLDGHSQLARAMFEADYLGKQLIWMPQLKSQVPSYQTAFAYGRAHPGQIDTNGTYRMWISIAKLELSHSPDGNTLETRGADMQFNIRRQDPNGAEVSTPQGYAELLSSLYDRLAVQYPVLHEIRECAKLGAAAQWLQTKMPGLALPEAGLTAWDGDTRLPGLIFLFLYPSGGGDRFDTTVIATGGVSLIPFPAAPQWGSVVVDSSAVDLRQGSLLTPPENFESQAVPLLWPAAKGLPQPSPVAWAKTETVGGQNVTAVTFIPSRLSTNGTDSWLQNSPGDRALALWKADDLIGAEQAYRQRLSKCGPDSGCQAALGALIAEILREEGDDAAASKALEDAVQLDSSSPVIRLLLCKNLADHGDAAGARSCLEHYMTLDPGNKAAAQILANLSGSANVAPSGSAATDRRTAEYHSALDQLKGAFVLGKAVGSEESISAGAQVPFDTAGGAASSADFSVVTPTGERNVRIPAALAKQPKMKLLLGQRQDLQKQHDQLAKELQGVRQDKAQQTSGTDRGQLDQVEADDKNKLSQVDHQLGAVKENILNLAIQFKEDDESTESTPKTAQSPQP
jgi:hypothetical protein